MKRDVFVKLSTNKYILVFIATTVHAVPPVEIPAELYDDYTLHGAVRVGRWYRDDSYSSNKPLIYTKEAIDANMQMVAQRKENYYGPTDTWLYQAIEKYTIEGKTVGVIGSNVPWYESVAVYYGGKPTTIEYNKIISQDERVKVMSVDEYERNPITFDVLFSISTYEHDGLGRYGDALDPYGDFKAMKKAHSMLNDGGIMFLAVPVAMDQLVWNVHRVYGRVRLPLLLEGWEIVESFGFDRGLFDKVDFLQPIFVLRKR